MLGQADGSYFSDEQVLDHLATSDTCSVDERRDIKRRC